MTQLVRDSYDAMAELYASLFLGGLDADSNARRWLAVFADLASSQRGVVVDLGCGPGTVVNHLTEVGLDVVGYDLSPGQVGQARKAFPDLDFCVGDLAALDVADSSVGGIVSRHSIIHMHPSELPGAFDEWLRVLEPGAPVLVSFFGSLSEDAHGAPFDHKVVTAYELHPETIGRQLETAGFSIVEVDEQPPPEGGRPFSQGTVLARRTAALGSDPSAAVLR